MPLKLKKKKEKSKHIGLSTRIMDYLGITDAGDDKLMNLWDFINEGEETIQESEQTEIEVEVQETQESEEEEVQADEETKEDPQE